MGRSQKSIIITLKRDFIAGFYPDKFNSFPSQWCVSGYTLMITLIYLNSPLNSLIYYWRCSYLQVCYIRFRTLFFITSYKLFLLNELPDTTNLFWMSISEWGNPLPSLAVWCLLIPVACTKSKWITIFNLLPNTNHQEQMSATLSNVKVWCNQLAGRTAS